MRRLFQLACFLGALSAPQFAAVQQVVDRIVARVEDDIVCLSELRELGQFQRLAGGQTESDDQLLDRLVDQWIVKNEADGAHFPFPNGEDVDRQVELLQKQFASPEAFASRLRDVGLPMPRLRRIVAEQLYLARYLDYKFRPAVQIEPAEIERYYRESLVPQLRARGEPPPARDSVEEQIRELLVSRGINQLADRWLGETRAHLRVERSLS